MTPGVRWKPISLCAVQEGNHPSVLPCLVAVAEGEAAAAVGVLQPGGGGEGCLVVEGPLALSCDG